jgi:hypothetical protein
MIDLAAAQLARLDVLVNNAAISAINDYRRGVLTFRRPRT